MALKMNSLRPRKRKNRQNVVKQLEGSPSNFDFRPTLIPYFIKENLGKPHEPNSKQTHS